MAARAFEWFLRQYSERDWLEAAEPDVTLSQMFVTDEEDLSGRRMLLPSNRKLRLFGCGCCRRIWHLLSPDWAKDCVLIGEAYADGIVCETELKRRFLKAPESLLGLGGWHVERVAEAASAAGEARSLWALVAARDVSAPDGGMKEADFPRPWRRGRQWCPERSDQDSVELVAQAALLRDVYGNPFRLTSIDPMWRTRPVLALAQEMYDSRDFSPMPIFSDALVEAGCEDEAIMAHCRSGEPHVRGCWVVDLILEKE
jgi:hypothetical protein